jgi:hypothetical protein
MKNYRLLRAVLTLPHVQKMKNYRLLRAVLTLPHVQLALAF